MSYQELFEKLWEDYIRITPSAKKVHEVLKKDNTQIINDHVAFRTFNIEKINRHRLAKHFLDLGYQQKGEYEFKEKKLLANHFEHEDPEAPKVFISELLLERCSDKLQKIVKSFTDSLPDNIAENNSFLYSGPHWQISSSEYEELLNESEYAAWMAAWGYHANHFTVSINHLESLKDIQSVNQRLKDEGFPLNTSGGEIKGSPEVLLEQSSTMADRMPVNFSDKMIEIPSCFYEFALRYPQEDGSLYQGFVAANANKIFDSTNVKPN